MFRYGMEQCEFHTNHTLSSLGWVMWLNPVNIGEDLKKIFGNKIRHGILVVEDKLSEDYIREHHLNPLYEDTVIEKNGLSMMRSA